MSTTEKIALLPSGEGQTLVPLLDNERLLYKSKFESFHSMASIGWLAASVAIVMKLPKMIRNFYVNRLGRGSFKSNVLHIMFFLFHWTGFRYKIFVCNK